MEGLREKLESIMSTPHLEGEDLQWWKDIQLQLGGLKQIQLSDTVDQAMEKLKGIGMNENEKGVKFD